MRISTFTDYSLRVLIQAAIRHPSRVTIDEVANAYGISRNHLIKVINELGRAGFLVTQRGRTGGFTLARPADRILVEDKASSTVQNAQFSVPLAERAGTSGIILVTSTTHQDRADGNFADAGANVLATVSYPDGNPDVNFAQFARDAISPFVTVS